ncbi:MAG: transposase [Candidatus Saccharimonadales bacterium]
MVELPPTIALSQAVKTFKGGSGRATRQAHPELREWLWGDSFLGGWLLRRKCWTGNRECYQAIHRTST